MTPIDLSNAVYTAIVGPLEAAEHAAGLRGSGHDVAQGIAAVAVVIVAARMGAEVDPVTLAMARRMLGEIPPWRLP